MSVAMTKYLLLQQMTVVAETCGPSAKDLAEALLKRLGLLDKKA